MEAARRATEDDLAAIVALWRAAVAETLPLRGGAALIADLSRSEPLEPALHADLSRQDRLIVSGCIDEVVVGVAAARIHLPPYRVEPPVAVVELVYVEPEARLIGVGEAMMDVVTEWGSQRGCFGIDAPALPGAREAKAFFETTGLVTRLLVMHRPIVADGAGPR